MKTERELPEEFYPLKAILSQGDSGFTLKTLSRTPVKENGTQLRFKCDRAKVRRILDSVPCVPEPEEKEVKTGAYIFTIAELDEDTMCSHCDFGPNGKYNFECPIREYYKNGNHNE